MIMNILSRILSLCVVLLTLTGCFKEEKQGTHLRIALYSQNVSTDTVQKCTSEIEGYAFCVPKGTKWEVTTWEDALNRVITNKDKPNEQMSEPAIVASYDPEAEYQVSYALWDMRYTVLVIVDKTNRIYATRVYETPMNIPEMKTQLHLYAHRKSGSVNGWDMVNPFPDEKREPLDSTTEEE